MSQKPRNLEEDLNAMTGSLAPQRSLAPVILQQLRSESRSGVSLERKSFRWRIMRVSVGIAAVAVFTATVLVFLTGPRRVYAQVLEQVEKAQSMSCDLEGEKDKMHLSIRGNMMRLELSEGGTTIGNRATGQWVSINPKNRTAIKITMMRQPFDLYAWFHDFKDGKEESIGDKQINGRNVTGFRVMRAVPGGGKNEEVPMTIWVDPATHLPVEAEGTMDGKTLDVTNFKWGEVLDEKLFVMDIPEGYKVQDMGGVTAEQLKAPPTTQEAEKLVLKAGVGVGELKFGDDAARITEFLGKPETVTSEVGWGYPSKGLWLTVSPKQGLILIMAGSKKAFPVFNVNDFPGKLENGLGIGSSREEIEKAYGPPERIDSVGNDKQTLYYDKMYLWFMVESGKVTQIYVNLSPAGRDAIRAKLATQAK
jgi:outer membrane lipoprotein-sorting protein